MAAEVTMMLKTVREAVISALKSPARLLSDGDRISAQTMHKALSFDAPFLPAPAAEGTPLRTLQAQALREALPASGRTRSEQAQALGISQRTLYRQLRAMKGSQNTE